MQKHAANPLIVSDVQGAEVDFVLRIPKEGFKERFAVDVIEGQKQKVVLMGFYFMSKTPLLELKKAVLITCASKVFLFGPMLVDLPTERRRCCLVILEKKTQLRLIF